MVVRVLWTRATPHAALLLYIAPRMKSSNLKLISLSIPTCSTDYFCGEQGAKSFTGLRIISRAKRWMQLAAAEIRFTDRKPQKVEFQPALRLARSKTNHLPIINLSLPSQTLSLTLLYEGSCAIHELVGDIALWLPDIQLCRRLFRPPSSPTFHLCLATSELSLIHNDRIR
jgi:hypothetical protein